MRENQQNEVDSRVEALRDRFDRIGAALEALTQQEREVADELALNEPARGNA